MQTASYRDCLIGAHEDAERRGKYFGRFRVRVSENSHSLHVGDADSNEEGEGRTQPSGAGSDIVDVVPPPTGPS